MNLLPALPRSPIEGLLELGQHFAPLRLTEKGEISHLSLPLIPSALQKKRFAKAVFPMKPTNPVLSIRRGRFGEGEAWRNKEVPTSTR